MPHQMSARRVNWEPICREVGLRYVDPRWPVARILEELCQTGVLITEAMHGAIVADALRIPWTPVVCLDTRLSAAARREGFTVVDLPGAGRAAGG